MKRNLRSYHIKAQSNVAEYTTMDLNLISGLKNIKFLRLIPNDIIHDLKVIEYCISIETLILCGNQIKNINVINRLPKLKLLDIRLCTIDNKQLLFKKDVTILI
jgi:Leucine-rich repeat (LRR) protein